MSRDLTPTTITAIEQPEVFPFFAVDLLFDDTPNSNPPSAPVYTWTGVGTLTVGGKDYVGAGQLLSISSIEETQEMAVRGATITLTGIPSNLISLALTQPYQGRVCNIYLGVMGEQVFNQLFSGYMDQMNIEESGETCTITMAVENKLIDLERARVARFTSGYQKSLYPNDLGLDFIEDLQDKKIPWGRSAG